MVNPNDPAAIPYVISEDYGVFWYIAYKEKSPGVPYITVSAKGVANGLSTEYNDGYDFGPDSYNPNISSGIPLTLTSGIQEAINYVRSFANGETAYLLEIHLATGTYLVHQPIYLKFTSTDLPPEVVNSTTNYASVAAPILIGHGNTSGQVNFTPTGTLIKAASDFPEGEYLYALLLPTTAWYSGATNPQWFGGQLRNIIFHCNNLAAGVDLQQFGEGIVEQLSIRNPTVPNPVITQAPDSTGQGFQTGAFVYTMTDDSGDFSLLCQIEIRGGTYENGSINESYYEDGFVLNNSGGNLTGIDLYVNDYCQRYGFNLSGKGGTPRYPMVLIHPECDSLGGWTGSVPSTLLPSPQSAGYYIGHGAVVHIYDNETYHGIPGNYPYIFNGSVPNPGTENNALYIHGGHYQATGTQYVIVATPLTTVVEDASFTYDSSQNGIFQATQQDTATNIIQSFKNISYFDTNTGTPAVSPYDINFSGNNYWQSIIHVDPFFDNIGRYFGGFPPSLSANPPVSATVYQNANPVKIRITLPVYATTSGTAGSVVVAMGVNTTGSDPPTIPTLYTKFINGSTSSSATELITLEVPSGWYYSFTGTGATFGTATVEAI